MSFLSFTLSVNYRSHRPFTRMLWMVWPVWWKWLATGLLKGFQSSCGRQHRQQPLLHNSKWLFSGHKGVHSSAGGKRGWNADAVGICRYEHKEIIMEYLPADYTHVLPVPCTPSEQFMPLLQGHCSPGKLWQEKGGLGDYIYIYTLLETQPITSRE